MSGAVLIQRGLSGIFQEDNKQMFGLFILLYMKKSVYADIMFFTINGSFDHIC